MADRTVSEYVDDSIADRLNTLAQAEARPPAHIVVVFHNYFPCKQSQIH